MSRFGDNIRRIVDGRARPVYTKPTDPEPVTTDGQPPRLPEPTKNTCGVCNVNELVAPPGGNPNAAPQCIKCDRIPRGKW